MARMSVPPLEAPIWNRIALPKAGRKMAKRSSRTGSVVRGAAKGYIRSSRDRLTEVTMLAYTVFSPNPFPRNKKPSTSKRVLAINVKSPADHEVSSLTMVEKPVTPPKAK